MQQVPDAEILYTEDNKVLGISFGHDYCTEHEWGIKDIRDYFGIEPREGALGLDARTITIFPIEFCIWVEDKKQGFICHPAYPRTGTFPQLPYDKELKAAWDRSGFTAYSNRPHQVAALKEIYEALSCKNAVIDLFGSDNPFARPGLCILIANRIPQEVLDEWYETDRKHAEMQTRWREEAGDLENILEGCGKRYHFLGNYQEFNGKLKAFLNPMDQARNNSGWFTVEELRQWADDEGPIVRA